jgi:hypothetical protein
MAKEKAIEKWMSLDGHTTITRDEHTGRLRRLDGDELICSTALGLDDACARVIIGEEVLIERVTVIPADHKVFTIIEGIKADGEVLAKDEFAEFSAEAQQELNDSISEICARLKDKPEDALKEFTELQKELDGIKKTAEEKKAEKAKAEAELAKAEVASTTEAASA